MPPTRLLKGGNSPDYQLMFLGDVNAFTTIVDKQVLAWNEAVERFTPVSIAPSVGVLSVEDYGAVGDGVQDDTVALQATIDAAKAMGGGKEKHATIFFGSGKTYKVTGSLDLTDMSYVTIQGNNSVVKSYGLSGKAGFDLLGSETVVIYNVFFTSDSVNPPSCHISLGRCTTPSGQGSGYISLISCRFFGYWTKYAIYNDSAELCVYDKCLISCSGPVAAKGGIYYGAYDDESIPSDFKTRADIHSAAGIALLNCSVGCFDTLTQFVPYYFGHKASSISLRDSFGYSYNSMPVIKTNGDIFGLILDNVQCEGTIDRAIYFSARSGAGDIREVDFRSCQLGTSVNHGIYQDAGTSIYRMTIRSSQSSSSGSVSALYFGGTVWMSHIDQWWLLDTGTVYFATLNWSRVEIVYHVITIAAGAGNEIRSFGDGTLDIGYTVI